MKLKKSDQKQLESLRSGNYEDASIHIILLDLCLVNDVESVVAMLHNVASDIKMKGRLEEAIRQYKNVKWPKYKTK